MKLLDLLKHLVREVCSRVQIVANDVASQTMIQFIFDNFDRLAKLRQTLHGKETRVDRNN